MLFEIGGLGQVGLLQLGVDLAQIRRRECLAIDESQHQGLRGTAKEPGHEIAQERLRRLLPAQCWSIAVGDALFLVIDQSGLLHVLQETKNGGIGLLVALWEFVHQFPHSERSMLPKHLECSELPVGNRDCFSSSHDCEFLYYGTISTHYCVRRWTRQADLLIG
jgi:hypothetical protein